MRFGINFGNINSNISKGCSNVGKGSSNVGKGKSIVVGKGSYNISLMSITGVPKLIPTLLVDW